MSAPVSGKRWSERGVGLVEIMISVVIGMLMVLVIYQVYNIKATFLIHSQRVNGLYTASLISAVLGTRLPLASAPTVAGGSSTSGNLRPGSPLSPTSRARAIPICLW